MVQARKIDQLDREKKVQEEVNEARKREVEDMLQYKSNIEEMLADYSFEYELLKMTNDEREIAIALRYANAEAASEEGVAIAEAIRKNQEFANSQSETISAMDTIRWAARMVDRRWAMIRVVRSFARASNARWILASVTESRAEVASSKIRMGGFFRKIRAIATRCF